jgi:UDP-glucose 4-epimerase
MRPDGEIGENHHPKTHLIPLSIEATYEGGKPLGIYAFDYPTTDGTAVRDYIYVADLAQAHLAAIRHLLMGGKSETLNLGTGKGTSVLGNVRTLEKVAGRTVAVQERPRREGDPKALVANAEKANRILGWKARRSNLDQILNTALAWRNKSAVESQESRGRVAVIGAGRRA